MGCSQSVPIRHTPQGPNIDIDPTQNARSHLLDSAFFSGANPVDIDSLARLFVLDKQRTHRKVPFASTETAILLGGVVFNWDFVSTQNGVFTIRNDVVGEECLLKPILAKTGSAVGSLIAVADVLHDEEVHPRKEMEYLHAERVLLSTTGRSRTWYTLENEHVQRLAEASKTFNIFLQERLQPRAACRLSKPGITEFLCESEYNFLSQAFDYMTLSTLAQKFPSEPCFFCVCDGKLNVSLEDVGPIEHTISIRDRTKGRKSTDLSMISSPNHRRSDSELSSAAAATRTDSSVPSSTNQARVKRTLTHTLSNGATFGENSIILDATRSIATFEVAEEGVALVLKQAYWEMFQNTVANDKTQKFFTEEGEFRSSPYKVRALFPCFRKCKSSFLRLLMDTVELVQIESEPPTQLAAGWVCFVRRGTIRVYDPPSEKENLYKQGQAFGYETILKLRFPASRRQSVVDPVQLHSSNSNDGDPVKLLTAVGSIRGTSGLSVFENQQTGMVSATMWRIPEKVLKQIFDADPIFAADFEFMVRRPNESFFTTPRRSIGSHFGAVSSSPPVIKQSPVSFQAVLSHPVAVSHFSKFVTSVHAQENLHFYWTVKHFPKTFEETMNDFQARWNEDVDRDGIDDSPQLSPEQSRERIVGILQEFVVEGARNQININSATSKALRAALEDDTVVDPECFASAVEEVFSILLTDSFPRFVANTDVFLDMVAEVLEDLDGSVSMKNSSRSLSQSPLRLLPRPSPNFSSSRKSLFSQRNLTKEENL